MRRFPFKLITFDVNGTLLKLKGPVGKTYSQFALRRGLSVDPDALNAGFRLAFKSMNAKQPNFGQNSNLGWHTWWKNVVTDTFKSVVEPANDSESRRIDTVADDLIKYFSTGESWELENDALKVLERLKANSIDLGIVSNTDPRLHKVIDDIGCSKYFVFVLTSYEAKFAKPNVEIFNMARQIYESKVGNDLETGSILHIGNSYGFDYLGATNAGWQSILVNCKDRYADENCLVINNLTDLDDYFVKMGCT